MNSVNSFGWELYIGKEEKHYKIIERELKRERDTKRQDTIEHLLETEFWCDKSCFLALFLSHLPP